LPLGEALLRVLLLGGALLVEVELLRELQGEEALVLVLAEIVLRGPDPIDSLAEAPPLVLVVAPAHPLGGVAVGPQLERRVEMLLRLVHHRLLALHDGELVLRLGAARRLRGGALVLAALQRRLARDRDARPVLRLGRARLQPQRLPDAHVRGDLVLDAPLPAP